MNISVVETTPATRTFEVKMIMNGADLTLLRAVLQRAYKENAFSGVAEDLYTMSQQLTFACEANHID